MSCIIIAIDRGTLADQPVTCYLCFPASILQTLRPMLMFKFELEVLISLQLCLFCMEYSVQSTHNTSILSYIYRLVGYLQKAWETPVWPKLVLIRVQSSVMSNLFTWGSPRCNAQPQTWMQRSCRWNLGDCICLVASHVFFFTAPIKGWPQRGIPFVLLPDVCIHPSRVLTQITTKDQARGVPCFRPSLPR